MRAAIMGVLVLLAGCDAFPPPQSPEAQQAVADCRAEADRVFNVRNRYQLSERDTTDAPFATSGLPSDTTKGLADQYVRDNDIQACLRRNAP